MSFNGESLSQAFNGPSTKIFTYPNGDSIPIFVDAGEISHSPKLLRTIRAGGAEIEHFPSNAHVILVDPTVNSGRRFIRDWSTDPNKVVLEYTWVTRCVSEGRALLAADDWGGLVAIDDGLPLRTEDGLNDAERPDKIPLPTPRPSPSDPESFLDQRSSQKRGQAQVSRRERISYTNGHDSNVPYLAASPNVSPAQPQTGTFPPLPSQYTDQNHFPTTQSFQPSLPTAIPQYGTGMTQPDYLALNMNLNPHANGGVGAGVNMNPLAYAHLLPPLMDVLRYPNTPVWGSQGQPEVLATIPQNGFVPSQHPQSIHNQHLQQHPIYAVQHQNFDGAFPPPPSSGSVGTSPIKSASFPNTPSHMRSSQTARTSSFVRSVPSRSSSSGSEPLAHSRPQPKHKRKQGKHPSTLEQDSLSMPSPVDSKSRRKRSLSTSSEADLEFSFTSPVGSPTLRPQPPPTGSPRKAGEIFRSDSGQPLSFFVQVDLRNRYQVIQKIKKNGGQITGDHLQANYAILWSRSAAFKDLLAGVQAVGLTALTPLFIDDCLEAGALLNIDERRGHVIDSSVDGGLKTGIRGRSSMNSTTEESKYRKERYEKQQAQKRRMEKALRESQQADSPNMADAVALADPISPISHSPTPPLPDDRHRMRDGRMMFSNEEKQFVLNYARTLFVRDVSMSLTRIAEEMFKKMPHHPSKSWYSFVIKKCRDDLEAIRKRVAIAIRKQSHVSGAGSALTSPINKPGPTSSHSGPTWPDETSSQRPALQVQTGSGHQTTAASKGADDERDDIDTICQFFVNGGGNDSDDEQVWRNLTNYKRCKTNPDWSEFYRERQSFINERIKALMRAQGGRLLEDDSKPELSSEPGDVFQ